MQVHGSGANAASKKVTWSQLPGLVIEACKLPLLWYLATAGLSCKCFAGDSAGDAHSLQGLLAARVLQWHGPFPSCRQSLHVGMSHACVMPHDRQKPGCSKSAPVAAAASNCQGWRLQSCAQSALPDSSATALLCISCVLPHGCCCSPGVLCVFSLNSWISIITKNMLAGTVLTNSTSTGGTSATNTLHATLLTAIPYFCAAVGMWAVASSSHHFKEKDFHIGCLGSLVASL